MSRDTIEVKICDRCGFGIEIRSHGQDAGWGRIWASAPHPDAARPIRTLSAENQQADICTDCADEFFAFWAAAPVREVTNDNSNAVREAWEELINYDDRTSPEEYPDMALIAREELAIFMLRAVPNRDSEATPPPPKRIDRALLEARIGEALREQVSASVGAIQEEPSSILDPEIPSAALTGIDLRAKRLAKQLAKELG